MAAWVAYALGAWVAAACWLLVTARARNAQSVARALCLTPGTAVLFVIAHPDDESMCAALLRLAGAAQPSQQLRRFFAPSIAALSACGVVVHLLCLSSGNAAGLGATRKRELPPACGVLGVASSRVTIVDLPELKDGMQERWPESIIVELVDASVRTAHAKAVVTFDARGVSGHGNHVATHRGVLAWLHAHRGGVTCWLLESASLGRKFTGALDVPLCALRAHAQPMRLACLLTPSPLLALRALRQHVSQWVWFRALFIVFAQCAYANVLVRASA